MTNKQKIILIIMSLAACSLCLIVANMLSALEPQKSSPSPARSPTVTVPPITTGPMPLKHRGGVAIGQCRQHVRDELLSPKSARFVSEATYTINGRPTNYHAVTGTVEAENIFGVVLKSRFRCDLHYLPDKPEMWVLDEFRLD